MARKYDAGLKKGRWLVLLYHYDCPKCQEAIRKFAEYARRSVDDDAAPHRFALVEMPPYGGSEVLLPRDPPVEYGRLRGNKQWFVQAPVAQEISDSIVVRNDVLGQ